MSENAPRRGPGRPKGSGTGQKPWKNVSVDADIVALLAEVGAQMESELGFRPTISQTIRRLVRIHTDHLKRA